MWHGVIKSIASNEYIRSGERLILLRLFIVLLFCVLFICDNGFAGTVLEEKNGTGNVLWHNETPEKEKRVQEKGPYRDALSTFIFDTKNGLRDRLRPGISLRHEFNDNLYKLPDASGWEQISTLTPSLTLNFAPNAIDKRKRGNRLVSDLSLRLSCDIKYYQKNKDRNRFSLGQDFYPSVNLRTQLSNRLNVFYYLRSRQRTRSELNPTERNRNDNRDDELFNEMSQNYGFSYMLGPKHRPLYIMYSHRDRYILNDEYQNDDSRTDTLRVTQYLNTSRLRPFIGGTYEIYSRPDQTDGEDDNGNSGYTSDKWSLFGGLTGQLFPRTNAYLSFGYSDVGKGNYSGSNRTTRSSGAIPTYRIGLNHIFSPRFNVFASTGQDARYSDTATEVFDIDDNLSLGFRYLPTHFNKRMTTGGTFTYSKKDYESFDTGVEDSEVITYTAQLYSGYRVNKWLRIYMTYNREERMSDGGDNSSPYTVNKFTISLRGVF